MTSTPDLDLLSPAFERSEYELRLDAVRDSMEGAGLDAVLLFHQESLYYLFGYDQIGYWVYQCAVVSGDGTPVVVGRKADEPMIAATGMLEPRIWLDDPDRDPIQLTVDTLREMGHLDAGARVGIELRSHALTAAYHHALRESLAGRVELVDASDLVAAHRIVKSAAEIGLMRRAAEIMDEAFLAARRTLASGVRETDLHAEIARVLYVNGADPPAVPPPIASGPRTQTQTHGSATERVIGPGDPVTIEIGAPYRRYHAVGLRSAVIGTPPTELEKLHAGLAAGLDAGERLIGPGTPTSDVAAATLEGLSRAGLSRAGRHVGYGIGIAYPPTWLEPYRIKLTDETRLAPGMTFFFFVGAPTEDERAYLAIGDPVLVTEEGHEILSALPRELWVV